MTQLVTSVIDDSFRVSCIARGCQKSLRNAKPPEISLELRQIDSDEVLITKVLPWPTGEELPSKITYDSKEEALIVQNQTTLAKIPFKTRLLKTLEEQHKRKNVAGPRIVTAFKGGKDESNDYAKVIEVIRDVIADLTDAKWKKLKKAVEQKLELSALFTTSEQSQLLHIIKSKIAAGDKDVQQVLKSLVRCDFFSYKMLNEVHALCESSSFDGVIDYLVQSSHGPLPEKTFVKGLKKAAGQVENRDYLRKLLDLPFEDKGTAAVASTVLSSSEAAALVGQLVAMYRDEEESARHGKVLAMLSLLLDSHSTQFLNDPETHDCMLEAASFIAAMTALTGTFAELECTQRARKDVNLGEAAKPEYECRTVRLEARPCPSLEEMKESNSKNTSRKSDTRKSEGKAKQKKKGTSDESGSD